MGMQRVFIFSLFVLGCDCIYDKCKLIQELNNAGVVGIKNYTLGDYLCLINAISGYDNSLHVSASEYGIFQINCLHWCDDNKTVGRKNLCGVQCSELLDENLIDDIQCFARILKNPDGISAWYAWPTKCEGKDNSKFTSGC
ncbi:lysozyme C-like [Leptodactylus fuscus]|uniref:lysozyme C-like n=1 Tax=Leptodactylus fuscus TaxID=238119 RepID=UPI003F4E9F90